jgi:hypothetical protein
MKCDIITYSGKIIDICNPTIADLDILDIAYGLSNVPRFAGQVPFISVAKHSLHVSDLSPPELKLAALLHDASEAYIGDMISPIKNQMKEYLKLEEQIMAMVSAKWNIDPNHDTIKYYDKMVLNIEKQLLFFQKDFRREDQKETYEKFLDTFNSLVSHLS